MAHELYEWLQRLKGNPVSTKRGQVEGRDELRRERMVTAADEDFVKKEPHKGVVLLAGDVEFVDQDLSMALSMNRLRIKKDVAPNEADVILWVGSDKDELTDWLRYDVPVVMGAYSASLDIAEYLRLGVCDIVKHPYRADKVARKLLRAIGRGKRRS
jgi:hypothetical protein